MTESEAIEVVCREVGDSEGFVVHVERTRHILAERVARFLDAVDVLAAHWAGRSEVPKRAVVPFVDIYGRLYAGEGALGQVGDALHLLHQTLAESTLGVHYTPLNGTSTEKDVLLVGRPGQRVARKLLVDL